MRKNSLFGRKDYTNQISEDQLEVILDELGVVVASQTDTHFLVYCAFHNNKHSTSATVAKENGYFYCWGAGCGKRCSLIDLIKERKHWDTLRAMRFIERHSSDVSIDKVIEDIFATKDEMPEFNVQLMSRFRSAFEESKKAQSYIASRGINEFSTNTFGLGFDAKRQMVITPMHDKDARLIGVIGRSIVEKRFQNSQNLPSRKTLFNYHRARAAGADSLVIVESNFDCIRAHQSGYPNTVATLSGSFSQYHLTQINRSFSKVILAVDVDEPGEAFASRIAKRCRDAGIQVYRMQYSQAERLPHGAKDLSDCSDEEIAQAIRFAELYVN